MEERGVEEGRREMKERGVRRGEKVDQEAKNDSKDTLMLRVFP